MPQAPDFVYREAAGLGRFADLMRADGGTRERVLMLPYEQSGYRFAQPTAMNQVLAWKAYVAGETSLYMLATKPS